MMQRLYSIRRVALASVQSLCNFISNSIPQIIFVLLALLIVVSAASSYKGMRDSINTKFDFKKIVKQVEQANHKLKSKVVAKVSKVSAVIVNAKNSSTAIGRDQNGGNNNRHDQNKAATSSSAPAVVVNENNEKVEMEIPQITVDLDKVTPITQEKIIADVKLKNKDIDLENSEINVSEIIEHNGFIIVSKVNSEIDPVLVQRVSTVIMSGMNESKTMIAENAPADMNMQTRDQRVIDLRDYLERITKNENEELVGLENEGRQRIEYAANTQSAKVANEKLISKLDIEGGYSFRPTPVVEEVTVSNQAVSGQVSAQLSSQNIEKIAKAEKQAISETIQGAPAAKEVNTQMLDMQKADTQEMDTQVAAAAVRAINQNEYSAMENKGFEIAASDRVVSEKSTFDIQSKVDARIDQSLLQSVSEKVLTPVQNENSNNGVRVAPEDNASNTKKQMAELKEYLSKINVEGSEEIQAVDPRLAKKLDLANNKSNNGVQSDEGYADSITTVMSKGMTVAAPPVMLAENVPVEEMNTKAIGLAAANIDIGSDALTENQVEEGVAYTEEDSSRLPPVDSNSNIDEQWSNNNNDNNDDQSVSNATSLKFAEPNKENKDNKGVGENQNASEEMTFFEYNKNSNNEDEGKNKNIVPAAEKPSGNIKVNEKQNNSSDSVKRETKAKEQQQALWANAAIRDSADDVDQDEVITRQGQAQNSKNPLINESVVMALNKNKVVESDATVSPRVKKVINSAIGSIDPNNARGRDVSYAEQVVTASGMPSGELLAESSVASNKSAKGLYSNRSVSRQHNSSITLKALNVSLGKKVEGLLVDFDFRPAYASEDHISDKSSGKILFSNNLNSNISVLSGTIIKNGQIPTYVDIALEKGSKSIEIPVIESESIDRFVSRNRLMAQGGLVLVEIGDVDFEVDLDVHYEAKIFLDGNFRALTAKESKQAKYILLLGINPGNRVLTYVFPDGKISKKIIFVQEDQLYYDMSNFIEIDNTLFSLYENDVFSKSSTPLSIRASDIEVFTTKTKIKKIGVNSYESGRAPFSMSSRQYVEFKHLNDVIYAGRGVDVHSINLPSNEYIKNIFKRKGVDDIRSGCMVQVNMSKRVDSIAIEGSSLEGMTLDVTYLGRDGKFTREVAPNAEKAFILGDSAGVVNVKVDYNDGTSDFLQTFCSEDSYLVEQL
ncbi:MAG: hypothetical protein HQK52_00700 [Oligoflexia bacterium]|nr:hypothetical protein [Oligoflexia bacterium]